MTEPSNVEESSSIAQSASSQAVDITAIIRDSAALDRALVASFANTVRRHRQLGLPLVVLRDHRVVHVPPDEMPIPDVNAVPERPASDEPASEP